MSNVKNSVVLIGHMGADPETKNFESGKLVARFKIATNEKMKNSGGESRVETQWHQIITWNKNAEFVEKYLKKGDLVAVQGKLVHRSYEDDKDIKHYVSEVIANDIQTLARKSTAPEHS